MPTGTTVKGCRSREKPGLEPTRLRSPSPGCTYSRLAVGRAAPPLASSAHADVIFMARNYSQLLGNPPPGGSRKPVVIDFIFTLRFYFIFNFSTNVYAFIIFVSQKFNNCTADCNCLVCL